MQYIDRFELRVPTVDAEHILEQWGGFPQGSGATFAIPYHDATTKCEVWGQAAQDAYWWWVARRDNPQWVPARIDLLATVSDAAMTPRELRSIGLQLMTDDKIRAVIELRERDRQGDKQTTMLTVGSYHSAKSLAVYGRADEWRVEARFRAEMARMVCEGLVKADDPMRYAVDAIERVQVDLLKEVYWLVGGRPHDLLPFRRGQTRTTYTPSERIRRGTKALIVLAEKHGLWDELARSIPEVYAALHARAEQEARWEQAELEGVGEGADDE